MSDYCLPRWQNLCGQRGAHLGPVGPRWAPCCPHETCYQGSCLLHGGAGAVAGVISLDKQFWWTLISVWFPIEPYHSLHIATTPTAMEMYTAQRMITRPIHKGCLFYIWHMIHRNWWHNKAYPEFKRDRWISVPEYGVLTFLALNRWPPFCWKRRYFLILNFINTMRCTKFSTKDVRDASSQKMQLKHKSVCRSIGYFLDWLSPTFRK